MRPERPRPALAPGACAAARLWACAAHAAGIKGLSPCMVAGRRPRSRRVGLSQMGRLLRAADHTRRGAEGPAAQPGRVPRRARAARGRAPAAQPLPGRRLRAGGAAGLRGVLPPAHARNMRLGRRTACPLRAAQAMQGGFGDGAGEVGGRQMSNHLRFWTQRSMHKLPLVSYL